MRDDSPWQAAMWALPLEPIRAGRPTPMQARVDVSRPVVIAAYSRDGAGALRIPAAEPVLHRWTGVRRAWGLIVVSPTESVSTCTTGYRPH